MKFPACAFALFFCLLALASGAADAAGPANPFHLRGGGLLQGISHILHLQQKEQREAPAPAQNEDTSSSAASNRRILAEDWSITLTNRVALPNRLNIPTWNLLPDGHINVVGNSVIFAEYDNYRTSGYGPLVEHQQQLDPPNSIFGGFKPQQKTAYDSGGKWFIGMYPPSNFNGVHVAFFHAETHWESQPYPNGIAWMSTGVATSSDGISWTPGQEILTSSTPKPPSPQWGGCGNGIVIFDYGRNRWMAFLPMDGGFSAAVSNHPLGAPGTWKKYYNGAFTEPGLGGKQTPLIWFNNQSGGNPSIVWNTAWSRWVMVYGGWDSQVYMAISVDLMSWSAPRVIVSPQFSGGKAWYPTIVGPNDKVTYGTAKLYWADFDANGGRRFMSADLKFNALT